MENTVVNNFDVASNQDEMSFGQWFVTYLITAIPIVGFIMLFVWAFGSGTNPNKANWAKASLILIAIGVVIGILLFLVMGFAIGGLIMSILGEMPAEGM
jgi:hypothetical protein